MKIEHIEQLVDNCQKNKTDMNAKAKLDEAISDYLKENKVTDDILSIIIKAMIIDRGSNFYDYLTGLNENELQEVMKTIKNNKTVKDGSSANALRMLIGLFYLSVIGEGNLASLIGRLIELIAVKTGDGKGSISDSVYAPIVDDYFIQEFDKSFSWPDWNTISANEESIITVCNALLISANANKEGCLPIKNWCNEGIRIANERLEKRKLEEQIPKSRVNDIEALANHYQSVEQKLRTFVYENDSLKRRIASLEDDIKDLNKEKIELEKTIKTLHGDVDEKNRNLDKAEKEIGERKALNDAFEALKKNDEEGLLRDIANALKTEYRDFIDSENDIMDIQLGEIYREKLKNIFKILAKKGVEVE